MTIALATKGVITPPHITVTFTSGEPGGAYVGNGEENHAHAGEQDGVGAFVREC